MDNPYYVYEVKSPEDGFYCHSCEKWHYNMQFFYNVCVQNTCLPAFRTCNKNECQLSVDGLNKRHVTIRDLSISQGHEAVLI